jgi:hypothetical protein
MWEVTLEIKNAYTKVPFKYKKLKDAVDFVEEIMDHSTAMEEELVFHIRKVKEEPVATTEGE